ncbi:monocarboxylate transporter 13-like [Patiria miniata]|uniref:Major facilitator superfamily (MFS) profile domain-containing protein n=1 Tax=Patiria miniata TaxID=46514 RepID=A0A913ZZA8_PATMI|nr:monocarboxylate transporter 13-like [Patiria miniata]XP_038056397.1 monocarboxylate transporter 13-like [Patiria miniata]XP_038056398.1 monocarboxylate transporter 13-like [Patiria miniata]XP_038075447.1 monocarboxylate transporter 13-like [Patiria miniata]XP_038075448.1 monocarboxylate transporter 13-like [Patiria miniata]
MIRLRVWWWRWVIPVVVCLQYCLTYGILYNYSILFVSLLKEFNSTAVLAGWPGSLGNALAGLVSPLTALLMTKMKFLKVVILGHVIICVGYLLTSIVPALGYAVFTFGVMGGVGVNIVIHAVTGLVLEWFPKDNFGRANGIAVLGSSLGMLAFSPLLSTCITQFGWRRALRYISVGTLALGIMVSFFLTDPPTEDEGNSEGGDEGKPGVDERERIALETVETLDPDHPTERTLVGEGQGDEEEPRENHKQRIHTPSCEVKGSSKGRSSFAVSEVFRMITDVEPWAWTIGACMAMMSWTFFGINFASFMDGRGLSSDRIAVVIMLFAIGEIGGKILISVVGDHLPCQRIYFLAFSVLLGTVALGVMTVVQTFPQMMALSIFSGFLRSALYGGSNAVVADLFSTSYSSGCLMILAFFPYGIGALLGAPLSGGLYDITGDYVLSLIVIAAIFVCASLTFLSIPFRRRMRSRSICCYSGKTRPVQL